MVQTLIADLRVIWACAKKDISTALTERVFMIIGMFVPLNYLVLMSLFAISGGVAPTAVVLQDSGSYAQQFYDAMAHAHSFQLQKASASEASELLHSGRIVAVVTVPATFDTRIQHNQPVQVRVEIDNLNTDFADDVRRAIPLSITTFYAKAFPDLVTITPQETDLHPHDTGYIQYLSISILVIGLVISGLLQSGTLMAREWEYSTMKDILLSPASRWAVVVGKMLGAYILSLASVLVVLFVLIIVIGVHPIHWGEVIGFTLLTLLIFIALGTLLGTLLKQRQAFSGLAFGVAVPLFFISGAFGPLSFETKAIQMIAQVFPVYYAIVLEQHAFHNFILNTYGVSTNALILLSYALGLVLLASITLRQSTVAH
jgi:ABC-type transport system involved in multi-copper enzyme maturation permease subunit